MDEKKTWHAPVCRSLDANATASDPAFFTDDSSSDNFVPAPDSGNAHDHSTPGQSDFS
jgi:hypothetical protein